jgi:hypothetical protein
MYTNSFIKEQMAQACDRNDIGLHLEVAADGINNANCAEFKGLQVALKELSELLLREDDVASQTASESASSAAPTSAAPTSAAAPTSVVPAPAPQNTSTVNAAVPAFKQPNSDITFQSFNGKVKTNYDNIMKKINNFLTIIDNKIDEAVDVEDKQTFTERKQKYEKVKPLLDAATTEDDVRRIITENQVRFDSGRTIVTGGTRKRRMRRVKTQRRRKNARTIKKKITNNKSGKRN